MRYELKYRMHALNSLDAESMILNHPAAFIKAFPDRRVNNIYFDTVDYHFYHENVNGNPHRKKLRLRWYGEKALTESKCALEIKYKNKQLGGKQVTVFDTDNFSDLNELQKAINKDSDFGTELIPSLQNMYWRSYYHSFDKKFRITIDSKQRFNRPNIKNNYVPSAGQEINIMELKFEQEDWDESRFVSEFIPFRQSKNSKYVNGINSLFLI